MSGIVKQCVREERYDDLVELNDKEDNSCRFGKVPGFMNKTALFVFTGIFSLLSGCSDNETFNVDPIKNLNSLIKKQGYTVIMEINKGDIGQKTGVGARLYKDAKNIPMEGGNTIIASTEIEKKPLNQFGDSPLDYATAVAGSAGENSIHFATRYQPVEARADRFYPADEMYVPAAERSFIGFEFDAEFPQQVIVSSPLPEQVVSNPDDSLLFEWQKPSDSDQVEITTYNHCTGGYRIIYRGNQQSETLSVRKILKGSGLYEHQLGEALGSFVTTFLTFGLVSPKVESIRSCQLDFYFKNIQYHTKDFVRETGDDKELRRVAIISRSKKVTVYYKGDKDYDL